MTVVKSLDEFVEDVPYTRYIQQAANFESLVESCASSGKPFHTYFDIELYNAWMEVFYMPLNSSDPDKKLVFFSYEMNPKADVDKLADISSETAANVIKTCLKLRETSDFNKSMKEVVKDIRKQCGALRCSILLTDYDKREYTLLCEDYDYQDEAQQPTDSYLTEEFRMVVESWPKLINKSNCFVITNERDMENAAKIAPEWITSLRYVGVTDLLTGVYNRNAMNNRISEDVSGDNEIKKPFGVFFIDVNGLKTINDKQGHLAGDNLLKDVAAALQEIKSEKLEIYRVGGDEFLIIAPDTTAESFSELKDQLIKRAERPERAHFAYGACHSSEYDDVRKAMQIADARMYGVKEEYYSRHPEYEWHNKPV